MHREWEALALEGDVLGTTAAISEGVEGRGRKAGRGGWSDASGGRIRESHKWEKTWLEPTEPNSSSLQNG